jgi:prepilin-type N-terminal cleavage/methylation domain-containing protein
MLRSRKGLTLVEVMVALSIGVLLTAGTLQMVVYATVLKGLGDRLSTGSLLIQTDVESIRAEGARLARTTLSTAALSNALTLTVNSTAGFAVNEPVLIGSDPNTYRVQAISGSTLTLSGGLQLAAPLSSTVVSASRCDGTAASGYAALLLSQLPALNSTGTATTTTNSQTRTDSGTATLKGQHYTYTRVASVIAALPQILQLDYTLRSPGGSERRIHAEVLPDAVYSCPQY